MTRLACLAVIGALAAIAETPLGLDLFMPVPEGNPLTADRIALGQRLFFDKELSRDRTKSCGSCHDPERAFSDGRAVAEGIDGAKGARNAPALINRGYGRVFFWDGRAATLEEQVLEPIFNPIELGLTRDELERRTGMRAAEVAAALASYVRSIRSGNSKFDRYMAGNVAALSAQERAGMELLRRDCVVCHVGPNFTDERFHNTGVAWGGGRFADEGRFAVTHAERDRGAFKTPTLREVAMTGPYMHDGSLASLEDVVEFYSEGGRVNPHLDGELRPRHYSSDEKKALLAFLRSLSGVVSNELVRK